jgi:hypothetical protein
MGQPDRSLLLQLRSKINTASDVYISDNVPPVRLAMINIVRGVAGIYYDDHGAFETGHR